MDKYNRFEVILNILSFAFFTAILIVEFYNK